MESSQNFFKSLFFKIIPPEFPRIDNIPLESKRGIYYGNLQDLLKAQRWYEANEETWKLMLKSVYKESQDWLNSDNLRNFPCEDLQIIDQLWTTSSKGHFGFSAQLKIWREANYNTVIFRERVGWDNYQDIKFDLSSSPKGGLPICNQRKWFGGIWLSWSVCVVEDISTRLYNCDIVSRLQA